MDAHLPQQNKVRIKYNQQLEPIHIDLFIFLESFSLLVVVQVDDQVRVIHDMDG
jgi:hypothetical protein